MQSDAQWAFLGPLVEACRPKAKTPPLDLRRTLSAILWRHQNGAKWRAIPQVLGPWWRAAQIFIR
ncbi:IS5 family transposase ISMex42 [Methylobacterium iners]|uniref:IS5 family transposase ISMex42 n=1 Tax=Methylobacterium iners TaxID=418707 RepID=A0ABQ4S5Q6_9HYPH|nr:IS5 family transposase ISMex42 [Methylobacterium iners]